MSTGMIVLIYIIGVIVNCVTIHIIFNHYYSTSDISLSKAGFVSILWPVFDTFFIIFIVLSVIVSCVGLLGSYIYGFFTGGK